MVGEELALARVISHSGRGTVTRTDFSKNLDRDLAVISGKSRTVADIIESPVHHRTRHQDHRRRHSESRSYASIHLQRHPGRPVHLMEGVPDKDFTRFTMDGFAPRWMGLTLIIDSSTTDGP